MRGGNDARNGEPVDGPGITRTRQFGPTQPAVARSSATSTGRGHSAAVLQGRRAASPPQAPENVNSQQKTPQKPWFPGGFARASYQNRTDDLFITSETLGYAVCRYYAENPRNLAVLVATKYAYAGLFQHSNGYTNGYT